MKTLSKTKLLAFRQCPKRLWLEINQNDVGSDSARTQASFKEGHRVGELARQIYDPAEEGNFIDLTKIEFNQAFEKTQEYLKVSQPIFEAGFRAGGLLSFADVLLPVQEKGHLAWSMIEVKSSTSVKDYHRDDAAIQTYVAKASGLPLMSIALACIDTSWVYGGDGNYSGLLIEEDLTEESFARGHEVEQWAQEAQATLAAKTEPQISTGSQCANPYECRFINYCQSQQPKAQYPVTWLRGAKKGALKELLSGPDAPIDMRDVDDEYLNEAHQKIKSATLSGEPFVDQIEILQEVSKYPLPALFLDFETIQFTVPRWQGTRAYQQIPFQFSCHYLSEVGKLTHQGFLQLDGQDPSLGFAKALIDACKGEHPIFVYNAGFEGARIKELAARFADLSIGLLTIEARLVDLYPIAKKHYYHPSQEGSWSIKKVLPALVPSLRYSELDGVKDGGMAMDAYLEATDPDTSSERQAELYTQLEKYCELDTYAMVKIWQVFAQRQDFDI